MKKILLAFILVFAINVVTANADEYMTPVTADILNTYDNMNNISNDNYYADKKRNNYKRQQKNNMSQNRHKKYPQSDVNKKSETKESPKWWRLRGSYFGLGTQFD